MNTFSTYDALIVSGVIAGGFYAAHKFGGLDEKTASWGAIIGAGLTFTVAVANAISADADSTLSNGDQFLNDAKPVIYLGAAGLGIGVLAFFLL